MKIYLKIKMDLKSLFQESDVYYVISQDGTLQYQLYYNGKWDVYNNLTQETYTDVSLDIFIHECIRACYGIFNFLQIKVFQGNDNKFHTVYCLSNLEYCDKQMRYINQIEYLNLKKSNYYCDKCFQCYSQIIIN